MVDAIIIGQSDIVRYDAYSALPLDRIDLFKDLVFLRMIHLDGRFTSHLDVLNLAAHGKTYADASYDERRRLLNIWNLPGLSSVLVANTAHHDGFNVEVINNFDSEFDRFIALYDQQPVPPLVGISTTFYLGYAEVRRIMKALKRHDPNMAVVLGGAFVNEQTINGQLADFEARMRKYGVSYILHAFNSDEDFPALLRAHQARIAGTPDLAPLANVPNLVYFDEGGAFQATKVQWQNPTLNSRPMLWQEVALPFVNRTIQLRAASGCPFACSFCTYPDTAGGHFSMELELIEAQLREIQARGGVDRIIFIDDTFNVPTRRFVEILKILKKFNFEWFSFLRVQYVTDEVAQLMKESGCRGVYLGIESSNDQVLKNMNKKATREGFVRGMDLLNKYGITTFVAFVVGFPGETAETIQENIDFLEENRVDFYSTKEFYYMPHASIHRDREKFGLSGMGNEWQHDTMDSKTAADMKIHMFRAIKNAIFIDPDTSLWYLAYLYDQGLSIDDIKACQRELNAMMLNDIDGKFADKAEQMQALRRILAGKLGAPAVDALAAR